jgi:hypothetical protein
LVLFQAEPEEIEGLIRANYLQMLIFHRKGTDYGP